eukprot:3291791-Pyramimonas_sp.AAC.1
MNRRPSRPPPRPAPDGFRLPPQFSRASQSARLSPSWSCTRIAHTTHSLRGSSVEMERYRED